MSITNRGIMSIGCLLKEFVKESTERIIFSVFRTDSNG